MVKDFYKDIQACLNEIDNEVVEKVISRTKQWTRLILAEYLLSGMVVVVLLQSISQQILIRDVR